MPEWLYTYLSRDLYISCDVYTVYVRPNLVVLVFVRPNSSYVRPKLKVIGQMSCQVKYLFAALYYAGHAHPLRGVQSCQVSRFSREFPGFHADLQVSRLVLKISRILRIPLKWSFMHGLAPDQPVCWANKASRAIFAP